MRRAEVFSLLVSQFDALQHPVGEGYQHAEQHDFKSAAVLARIDSNHIEVEAGVVAGGICEVTQGSCHRDPLISHPDNHELNSSYWRKEAAQNQL